MVRVWKWGAFMPHAPIIVPEVGGVRNSDCRSSVRAMEKVAEETCLIIPSFLLVLDPHAPFAGGCTVLLARKYSGSLADFGVRSVSVEADGAGTEGERLVRELGRSYPLELVERGTFSLDYGAVVPLSFLKKAWGGIPPMLLMNPIGLGYEEAWNFGRALARYESEETWALVASGDLSHRLSPGAPGGYHPDGQKHDKALCEAMEKGTAKPVFELGEAVISRAGECGLRSALTFMGLAGGKGIRLLSYEGPFGVGYTVALWKSPEVGKQEPSPRETGKEQSRPAPDQTGAPYTSLARRVLEQYLERGVRPEVEELLDEAERGLLREKKACFVSLKKPDGTLRGCIGTIEPVRESLAHEIAENACAAATRDPRFSPVTRKELEEILLSVDVLSTPEPVRSPGELDPSKYGVIVEKGPLRGVLLPDLPGVRTVEEQLGIAMKKAGITNPEHVWISRFTVDRYSEKGRR
ncbi:MAG: AmmeMemoRadiSam system protein A [Thermovirgaceae bacterium]